MAIQKDPKDPVLAFQAQLDRAMNAYNRDRDRVLRDIQASIQSYRDKVVATFAGVTDWDAARVDQLARAHQQASAAIEAQLSQQWVDAANLATTNAILGVDSPLEALGLSVKSIQVTPLKELAILNDYVPSLIKGATEDVQKQVKDLMQRAALGGLDTRDIVKQIGDMVGPLKPGERGPGTIFSRTEIRAKNIVRTEMNRVHNLTRTQRIGELSEKFPGVGQKWIHRPSVNPRPAHLALHGRIIYPAKKEKFELDGFKVSGPHDINLPAKHTVNCHCGSMVVYDQDVGAQGAKDSPYVPGDGSKIPTAKGKTGPGVDLQESEKIIQVAEAKIHLNKNETGIVFSPDGTEVFRKQGGKNYVSFSTGELAKMKGQVLTHNHPKGSSFSDADILLAATYGLKEVRAVGRNPLGRTFRHVARVFRPKGMPKKEFLNHLESVVMKTDMEVINEWTKKIVDGQITATEANAYHWHEIWTRIASSNDWLYYASEELE